MLKKLAKLERLSRQLDPGPAVRKELFEQVGDYAESFLDHLPETKTYVSDDDRNGFLASPMDEMPAEMAELAGIFPARGRYNRHPSRFRRTNGLYPRWGAVSFGAGRLPG